MHRAYIVKMIPFTFPNVYHVVNTEDKITHSSYDDLIKARSVMRDMNLAIKRERTMAKAKRESHLRLVK
jgi:hypothetical protein